MGWDGMGWDGMGWDGMGWDGMGWNGVPCLPPAPAPLHLPVRPPWDEGCQMPAAPKTHPGPVARCRGDLQHTLRPPQSPSVADGSRSPGAAVAPPAPSTRCGRGAVSPAPGSTEPLQGTCPPPCCCCTPFCGAGRGNPAVTLCGKLVLGMGAARGGCSLFWVQTGGFWDALVAPLWCLGPCTAPLPLASSQPSFSPIQQPLQPGLRLLEEGVKTPLGIPKSRVWGALTSLQQGVGACAPPAALRLFHPGPLLHPCPIPYPLLHLHPHLLSPSPSPFPSPSPRSPPTIPRSPGQPIHPPAPLPFPLPPPHPPGRISPAETRPQSPPSPPHRPGPCLSFPAAAGPGRRLPGGGGEGREGRGRPCPAPAAAAARSCEPCRAVPSSRLRWPLPAAAGSGGAGGGGGGGSGGGVPNPLPGGGARAPRRGSPRPRPRRCGAKAGRRACPTPGTWTAPTTS
ncbi:A-type potassium channel modulatory protein KCNIP2 isoform X1 [Anas platyrhynchos]|uniref:A-type potassium channel modulatory protein KCNIP2 isoform X1 n=1 Tax=Anas platyrhynchos TaxID=8839 RepID=UPI003AF2906E